MKNTLPTLSDEIKKNIVNRIFLCVFIIAIVYAMTISYYVYLFTTQTRHHLDDLSNDLTPYIISQEIIKNRYAINLKLDELSNSSKIKIKWFKNTQEKREVFKFFGFLKWKYIVPVRAIDNRYYGYYIISGSLLSNQWMFVGLFMQFFFLIIFIMLICFILYPIAYSIPKKIIINPINALVELLHKNDPVEIDSFTAPYEIVLLRNHFIKILSIQNQILKKAEILKISTQVAHDIRSPLAAINVAISDVSSIPENKRVMIKNASQRINDIANNLLLRAKVGLAEKNDNKMDVSSELIFVVLDNIVTEKRYEYDKREITFDLNVSESNYDCFSNINLEVFKRILSNLINNSIEAIIDEGKVIVCLSSNKHIVEISIQDNGCGIPHDMLSSVMMHGFSLNKKNGAGLGLTYARQQIEQLKGEITIQSATSIGTKVAITLPRSNFPSWFCDNINVNYNAKIIILDDDPSIHDAWNQRLSHMPNLNITHYKSIAEFLIAGNEPQSCDALYLIDYEFLLDDKNGVDVIEQLNIQQHSILVTSAFEDQALRTRCLTLGIKIIPKPYVPYIPISVAHNPHSHTNIILIDDNKLVRMTWQFAAKKAGCDLKIYSSFESFVSEIDRHDKSTAIYLDSDLGNGIKGEECAYRLFQQGFTNIHITTGYCVEKYLSFSWIKTVIGKTPPFYIVK